MTLWKHNWRDIFLLMLSSLQLGIMLFQAQHWDEFSSLGKTGGFVLLVFLISYNIIVVSHLFTHTPWFNISFLNRLVSILNSINAGQSIQVYQLMHVRNHHRYNNSLEDYSSTFIGGLNGNHTSLFQYAMIGALSTLKNLARNEILSFTRLFALGQHEQDLLNLASKTKDKRTNELRQIRLDRAMHCFALILFLILSWRWTVFCYLPAFYIALSLVNMQNYYEHYGSLPNNKFANSASYYGKLYNRLSFNDGYHQEHHLRPEAHWRMMPEIRQKNQNELDQAERIISPVPAIFGFLDRKRTQLHIKEKVYD